MIQLRPLTGGDIIELCGELPEIVPRAGAWWFGGVLATEVQRGLNENVLLL